MPLKLPAVATKQGIIKAPQLASAVTGAAKSSTATSAANTNSSSLHVTTNYEADDFEDDFESDDDGGEGASPTIIKSSAVDARTEYVPRAANGEYTGSAADGSGSGNGNGGSALYRAKREESAGRRPKSAAKKGRPNSFNAA